MLRRLLALAVAAAPVAAGAETPMSVPEFEVYTTGKTLYYATDGYAYGIEEYFEGRRVRWSFLDGECQEGEWYPAGDMICFVYDGIGDPQCWTFYDRPGGLLARFENDPEETELVETKQTKDPLTCLGPKTGV